MKATCPSCKQEAILRWLTTLLWQCLECGRVIRGYTGEPGRLAVVGKPPEAETVVQPVLFEE